MVFSTRLVAFAGTAVMAVAAVAAPTTESRAVGDFDAISLRGSMNLVVRQAARPALELRAEPDVLPMIETTIDGRTLTIAPRRDATFRNRGPITVTVDVVQLKSLSASGAGDLVVEALKTPALELRLSGSSDARLRGLAADELRIKLSGSGDVEASGGAKRLAIRIAGSGDVRTRELQSDDVDISIAGSGDASVTANHRLAVSIAGSGDVVYAGNPAEMKTSIAGSGSISKK